MNPQPKRLYIKELAAELHGVDGKPHSRGFVHAMKRAGFKMPDGRATIAEAEAWLRANPAFSWRSVYVTKKFVPRPGRTIPLRII